MVLKLQAIKWRRSCLFGNQQGSDEELLGSSARSDEGSIERDVAYNCTNERTRSPVVARITCLIDSR